MTEIAAVGGVTNTTVSVSLAELVCPLTVTLAVLVIRVPTGTPLLTLALMVKVTLPPLGSVGMVRPAPCMAALERPAGHVAPPLAEHPIGSLVTVRLATAGSLNTAALPLAVEKVMPALLVITTV